MTADGRGRNQALRLTPEEQAILAGESGPALQRALEIIVALARIYGAKDLVPVASVQVSGVSYKNLGQAGHDFLQEWAAQGARARVTATLNPAGMDLLAWRDLGISESFADQQRSIITAYTSLGIAPTCTCTPYLVGYAPSFGQHLAWAESSAVSYANSVLGARTNREGGPSALAAAIAGRTGRYGLHLDENRLATALIDVRCPIRSEADLGALGCIVGQWLRNGVPFFRFRDQDPTSWDLKALGAAMAASGAVGLYHIEGVTPEEACASQMASCAPTLVVDDLVQGYVALDGGSDRIDLVSLGCPHASVQELQTIADFLDDRRAKTALWITTARATRVEAERLGLVSRIEEAGGKIVADTCLVVTPVSDLGFRSLATNSAKMAIYAPAHCGLTVRFGTIEQCLEAALTGSWAAPSPEAAR